MPPKPGHLSPEQARTLAAQRKTNGAGTGRPKVLRPCPQCGVVLSARELWRHRCPPPR